MKKYPKPVRCDERGQLVIPRDIRSDLNIEEGTGFWVFSIEKEGILLKKLDIEALDDSEEIMTELEEKAEKINLKRENLSKAVKIYKKTTSGRLEVI